MAIVTVSWGNCGFFLGDRFCHCSPWERYGTCSPRELMKYQWWIMPSWYCDCSPGELWVLTSKFLLALCIDTLFCVSIETIQQLTETTKTWQLEPCPYETNQLIIFWFDILHVHNIWAVLWCRYRFPFEYCHFPYFIGLQVGPGPGHVEPKRVNLNHMLKTLIPLNLVQWLALL